MIDIHIFPAKNGDCFLISINASINILVDAGYKETATSHLIPKLVELRRQGKKIDLFIITHIDEDHIEGAIELLKQNGSANNPSVIEIKEIWHNSYKHISQINHEKKISDTQIKQLQAIILGAQHVSAKPSNEEEKISAHQGSTLAAYLLAGNYQWNSATSGRAISTENISEIKLEDDSYILLLSPSNNQLLQLDKYWKKELFKHGYLSKDYTGDNIFDDAMEFLLKFPEFNQDEDQLVSNTDSFEKIIETSFLNPYKMDTSPKNGSSIAFLLFTGGKKLLFTGDAFSEVVEQNLRRIFPKEEYLKINLDIMKLSHHGSKFNNSPTLLEMMVCESYIFSTDGSSYHHPSIETIAHILKNNVNHKKRLIFNYDSESYKGLNIKSIKKKYNFEIESTSLIRLF